MAEIKRFDVGNYSPTPDSLGNWVAYEDHKEAVVKLNVELVAMSEEKEYWRTLAMQAAQRGR